LNEKVEKNYEELKKKGEELDAFISQQASVFFEQNEKQRDIELRKWCVEQYRACGRVCDERAADIYRVVTTGDATAIDSSPFRFRIESLEQENKKLKE
ncbi:MAG: hypothetical protein IJR86_02625, partial [Bacteroidaceae bacterium]|nr:hypothetical protein [Bacteroidaceae bacterium]